MEVETKGEAEQKFPFGDKLMGGDTWNVPVCNQTERTCQGDCSSVPSTAARKECAIVVARTFPSAFQQHWSGLTLVLRKAHITYKW